MRLPQAVIIPLRDRLKTVAIQRRPDLIIGEPEHPYMRRWWIIPRNSVFNIYLHQFLRSDDDRALHDHPWINASILIDGQYMEHTIDAGGINKRKRYVAGDIKFRCARSAHRVELIGDRPCWSLFLTGPVVREWGFHCVNGWRNSKVFAATVGGCSVITKGCD